MYSAGYSALYGSLKEFNYIGGNLYRSHAVSTIARMSPVRLAHAIPPHAGIAMQKWLEVTRQANFMFVFPNYACCRLQLVCARTGRSSCDTERMVKLI